MELDFAFLVIKYEDVRSGKLDQRWLKNVATELASILFLIYSR